jgi:diaminopimelate epimerase
LNSSLINPRIEEMEFSKYEATANDFIMLDRTRSPGIEDLTPGKVRALCDRRTGVGADGVIVMLTSEIADFAMRIFNADGSEAQMCGNGVRAIFLFALDIGLFDVPEATLETVAGIKTVQGTPTARGVGRFTVNMGSPAWTRPEIPMMGEGEAIGVPVSMGNGTELRATCVSMGNPHCVFFVESVRDYPLVEVGPRVEKDPLFPENTNVEVVSIAGPERLEMRVWERGVGETMACGTGACASLVAANLSGLTGKRAIVSLAGGDLEVEWLEDGVRLTGSARHVFDGKTVD